MSVPPRRCSQPCTPYTPLSSPVHPRQIGLQQLPAIGLAAQEVLPVLGGGHGDRERCVACAAGRPPGQSLPSSPALDHHRSCRGDVALIPGSALPVPVEDRAGPHGGGALHIAQQHHGPQRPAVHRSKQSGVRDEGNCACNCGLGRAGGDRAGDPPLTLLCSSPLCPPSAPPLDTRSFVPTCSMLAF